VCVVLEVVTEHPGVKLGGSEGQGDGALVAAVLAVDAGGSAEGLDE
jgi:hypothetical protein